MKIEFTRIVWDPNKRTPSSWLGLVVIQGFGSLGGGTFLLFWSKATVTLTHSVSKIKIGLVLYTKVDFLDSGDLGNKVNCGVVMVHFEISSKLISPWYLAWNVFSGHSTKDSVGFWKNKKIKWPEAISNFGCCNLQGTITGVIRQKGHLAGGKMVDAFVAQEPVVEPLANLIQWFHWNEYIFDFWKQSWL